MDEKFLFKIIIRVGALADDFSPFTAMTRVRISLSLSINQVSSCVFKAVHVPGKACAPQKTPKRALHLPLKDLATRLAGKDPGGACQEAYY
jgi:hypothetical protein